MSLCCTQFDPHLKPSDMSFSIGCNRFGLPLFVKEAVMSGFHGLMTNALVMFSPFSFHLHNNGVCKQSNRFKSKV
ncbi:hypothetical protein BLOT_000920 [Blomia tropicalis]|nr:hypothetical protein BLOT_000920 [Blomia tropicalis]